MLRSLRVDPDAVLVGNDELPEDRFRLFDDPLLARDRVLTALGHRSIDTYLDEGRSEGETVRSQMLTKFDEFGAPTLAVHTDDGYEPTLNAIVDWLISRT